jgi:hypothetical protein
VLDNFTCVANADGDVSVGTTVATPIRPNKENITPVTTKDQKMREATIEPTGQTALLIVDGDDTHGSVCSDGSDLSENVTLAQILTRASQHNEEHHEEKSPDQSTIIKSDDVFESQYKVRQLSHKPTHVKPIMTNEACGRKRQFLSTV